MLIPHVSKMAVILLLSLTFVVSACTSENTEAPKSKQPQEQATDSPNDITEANSKEAANLAIANYERKANDVLLKRLILAETNIESATNDFDRTSILREWVYANTNYAYQSYQSFNAEKHWYDLVHPTAGNATAGAHLGAHLRNEVGDMCGHLSWLLQKVYVLWGYEAGAGGWNVPGVFGHTYTLVKIQHEDKWVWQIQDATYDYALTQNGQPIDIVDVMNQLKDGKPHQLLAVTGDYAVSRNVLIHKTELSNVTSTPDFYVSQTPKYSSDTLHVFESDEKWEEFKNGPTGRLIGEYMAKTFGLPKDPIYALLLATTAPDRDSWKEIEAITQTLLNNASTQQE